MMPITPRSAGGTRFGSAAGRSILFRIGTILVMLSIVLMTLARVSPRLPCWHRDDQQRSRASAKQRETFAVSKSQHGGREGDAGPQGRNGPVLRQSVRRNPSITKDVLTVRQGNRA